MVSITALSAVGAAFSAGGAAVCAIVPEVNARTPASAAAIISDLLPRPIACLLLRTDLRAAIIAGPRHLVNPGMTGIYILAVRRMIHNAAKQKRAGNDRELAAARGHDVRLPEATGFRQPRHG